MLSAMLETVFGETERIFDKEKYSFALLVVKFPCAIALHLSLYPEVMSGM